MVERLEEWLCESVTSSQEESLALKLTFKVAILVITASCDFF